MSGLNLSDVYQLSVDELLKTKTSVDKYFNQAFDVENQIKSDDGKAMLFARCYDLTMTYLAAKQNIEIRHAEGLPHAERQELMAQAERIKDAGAKMFNGMVNSGMYFNQENMQHFYDFWNAFYNGAPYNAQETTAWMKNQLDQAHDVFVQKENVKMSSEKLGVACLQFAGINEFSHMVGLALEVENKNIHDYADYMPRVDRRLSDIREKFALESKITDRGFVTHAAFALESWKFDRVNTDVRKDRAESVERYVLSTPGIPNRVSHEYNHVGIGKLTMCSILQQRTFGSNRATETFTDFVRGLHSGTSAGAQLLNDMKTIMTALTQAGADPTNQQKVEKLVERFEKNINEKMSQTVLGKGNDSYELKDVALSMLLLDAKLENHVISEAELFQRTTIRDAIKYATDKAKGFLIDLVKHDPTQEKESPKLIDVDDLSQDAADYAVELIDRHYYDGFPGEPECDGERGMANLRLVSHLMTYGEEERMNNPIVYNQAMEYLSEHFERGLDILQAEQEIQEQEH